MGISPDPRQTAAWSMLEKHAQQFASIHLSDLLDGQENRYCALSVEAGELFADFSRCRADEKTLPLLVSLAEELHLSRRISELFEGSRVNTTEQRAALHTSLRAAEKTGPVFEGDNIAELVSSEQAVFLDFADSVRNGTRTGYSGKAFSRVINIGIGGSDLGPRFVSAALGSHALGGSGPEVRFVAGLDGMELQEALSGADPEATLVIVCSKTFTTLETLSNARAARLWLLKSLPDEQVPGHFAAVSVNHAAMDEFGIADDARFSMWDWVGGRFSLWSPVGLSAAISVGKAAYLKLLEGAAAMDAHFRAKPFDRNIPVLHGLLSIWQQNFLGLDQHVVLPYDQRLARLPDYLQQLWMESLGKSVRHDGAAAEYLTGSSLWGNTGSSAQHSFSQWLHQGSARARVDYIGTANGPVETDPAMHLQSLSNMLAQAEVLARGTASSEPHRLHPGNRPSTVLLMRSLTPSALGSLIAMYEHSVYVQSVIWGINAFDQYGVEQGKAVASDYASRLEQKCLDDLPPVAEKIRSWRRL